MKICGIIGMPLDNILKKEYNYQNKKEGQEVKRIHSKLEGLLFLASSIIIMFVVLFIANQANIIQSQEDKVRKAEHLLYIEEEFVRETEMRKQVEAENEKIKLENEALTDVLFNQVQMYELIALNVPPRSDHLSRSEDRQATLTTMPITTPSDFTSKNLRRAFDEIAPGMRGTEEYFVLAEELYGINSVVLAAIAIVESGGNTSKIAKNKNNLCGLGANDGSAYKSAIKFNSCEDSIYFLAELLATQYAPGGKYYGGSHDLRGVNVNYASDPKWAIKNSRKIIEIVQEGIENPEQLMEIANIKYAEGINGVQS